MTISTTMYNWNDVVKIEPTGRVGVLNHHKEYQATLACGATGTGWGEGEAAMMAELNWHNHPTNYFVVRHGAPVHVENTQLTVEEVAERVPGFNG